MEKFVFDDLFDDFDEPEERITAITKEFMEQNLGSVEYIFLNGVSHCGWYASSYTKNMSDDKREKLAVIIINYETAEAATKLKQKFLSFNTDNFDLFLVENGSSTAPLSHANEFNSENIGFDQALLKILKKLKTKNYAGY
jgi:hypothetical protein